MSNIFGENLKISIFGESHSNGIGATIDGLPAGFEVDRIKLEKLMSERAPNKSASSTSRNEKDVVEVLCGMIDGITTGAPLSIVIRNTNTHSSDYEKNLPRASHSDYTANKKYNGFNDYRGGGHFSGRITAPLTYIGGLCIQILESYGITITTEITQIGKQTDPNKFNDEVQKARANLTSVGGIINCKVSGIDKFIGNPFFNSLESEISKMMFSIPAIKGIEFGDGFGFATSLGNEVLDELYIDNGNIYTKTNHNGGINGGISNLMPITFNVVVKPTASIFKEQHTVNLETNENTTYTIKGRHDSCIVPRAMPVVRASTAIVILDSYLNYR